MDVRNLEVLSAFRRVIVFAEQPWSILSGVSQGFRDKIATLKNIVQEVDELLGNHTAGKARNILEEENHLFYRLQYVYLLPVLRVARAVGRTVPGVKHLLSNVPVTLTKGNIIATARGVLNASAPHAALLAANGLPTDFRDRLAAAITAVENRKQLSETERQEAVRITKAIVSATKRGRQEVACIDPVIQMLCKDDIVQGPEILRAWSTARRIQKIAKPSGDGEETADSGSKNPGKAA